MPSNGRVEEEYARAPLLDYASSSSVQSNNYKDDDQEETSLKEKFWIESNKLWQIVGPAIFSRVATYSLFVITQAFAGHLGDLELAAISIATIMSSLALILASWYELHHPLIFFIFFESS